MKTLIDVPIRLRVDAETLSADGPLIEQLVTAAVERVLARAAAVVAKDGREGERVFHPPELRWGGPALAGVTQQARSALEARILAAIEAQVAKHRPRPPAPTPVRMARPWFVVKAVYFHTTPRQFFKYRAEVKTYQDVVDPLELYAHLLDTRTRAVAWLVQVNQELPIHPLGEEVFTRFSTLEKVGPKKRVFGAYTWSDRVRRMLEDLDQDRVVRGAFPSLQKTREKLMEVRAEAADKVAYIKRGGRLLFAFMPLPAFNLLESVRLEPVRQATLPLRELEGLVGAFDFKLVFDTEWAHARAAYGDDPVSLQLEPFVVERPLPERSLGALFEARRRLTSDVRWVGRTLLLNPASLAPLTVSVQALLRPLGDVTTQAVPAAPPQGHTWQPGWRGVSITPTFSVSRERLDVASWHPWAQRNAALLSGYLKLGRYERRDNVFRWLEREWFGTVRPALLELLLQELERLSAHEAFLTLLRDEASFFVFNTRSLVRLVEQTRYAELARRLGVVESFSRATRKFRRHDFDVTGQQLRLWHDSNRVVRANDVLAQHAYIFQEKIEALRPTAKTLDRLAGPMKKRVGELMGQILCEGKERTQEELIAQAMQEAADALSPPLGKDDFEEVALWTSYRFVGLEQTDPYDPASLRVRYTRVRKINDGPWEDTTEVLVDDVEKFGLYLTAYEIKNMERGVTLIAGITVFVMGGIFLAEAGAVGFMVRLGGGRLPVLLGIAAREAIYLYKVATGQEEFSLGGFLLNAFKGWLDAVGFRFGSLAGGALGRLVTAGGVRLLMTGAAVRIITRALGVGVSFVVEQFIDDVIVLVRCNRWQGSAKKYLQQLGFGFLVGLGFELALPFLGAVAKPIFERIAPVLRATPGKLEVAKLLLKELTPEQAALWLRAAMERVELALREVLDNPKVLQEMGEALRAKARELLDAVPEALKALPATAGKAGRAVKREYQVAFFNDLFDLAKIELKGTVLEGFERLLGAAGTRDVYATVRTLLRHKNAEAFVSSLRRVDESLLKRLLESGELDRIIGSDRVRGFLADRGELGWKVLADAFDSSAVKLEALLKDLDALAPDVRDGVIRLLGAHGASLPPAMRGNVEELARLARLEGTPAFEAELAKLGRQTRADVLLRKVTPEAITPQNARAILEKVKQAEKAGQLPVNYELRQEILTRSRGELLTIDAYTHEMPKGMSYEQVSAWIAEPAHWLPERRLVQQQLVQSELAKAQALSARLNEPDVVYALRGNTAAGKTTTVKKHPTIGPKALDPSGELSGVLNPDTIKGRIVELEQGVTSSQTHREGSMLSGQVEKAMLEQEGSALVYDRRFSWPKEIPELLQAIGRRKLKLIDIDVPLETSAVRVLMRNPGTPDPLVPFDAVAQGFAGIRKNREALLVGDEAHAFKGVKQDPRITDYELHVTNAQGQSVLVAAKRNGTWVPPQTPAEEVLFAQAVHSDPVSLVNQARAQVIDDAFIQKMTSTITDPGFKSAVEKRLAEYRGKTLEAALDAHSKRLK